MLENYYYGKLYICLKSGYKTCQDKNGTKYCISSVPRLQELHYVICKKSGNEYIDIKSNKKYDEFLKYFYLEKGKLYLMNKKSLKNALKEFSIKEKLQIIKTIILIESTEKLGKLTNDAKEETNKVLKIRNK